MYLRQFLVGDPGRGVGGGKWTPKKWFRLVCHRAFCSKDSIYALTLTFLDTNIIILLPTPPGAGAGFGDSPGHPAHPRLPAVEPAACRRGPGPGFCAYRHWASRTRAVSLLTEGYTPLLALYLMKRKGPQSKYSHNLRGGTRDGSSTRSRSDQARGTAQEKAGGQKTPRHRRRQHAASGGDSGAA